MENGPVELKVYRIDNGSKSLLETMTLDPAKHLLGFVTPSIYKDEARIEIAVVEETDMFGSRDYRTVRFPVPETFGCNLLGGMQTLSEEERILHYWIHESKAADSTAADDRCVESMLKASTEKDVSYILITAEPMGAGGRAE